MAARVVSVIVIVLAACGARATEDPKPSGDALADAVRAGEYRRTTSVIAFQDGRQLHEAYFGGTDVDTLHDIRSVTKSLAALAVGLAITDGALPSVEAPAFAYLGDLRPFAHDGPAKQAITIEDLLTMSSALDCNDNVAASPGNEENMYRQRAWSRWAVDLPVRALTAGASEHGFSYCTAGVFLLGQIVQRATSTPIDRYLEAKLLAPLGITRVEWNRSPTGEVATSGQLRIRTRDLAALAHLVLHRGRHGDVQVLPAAWIDRMLSRHADPDRHADPRDEHGYGYLMWQREYTTPCGRAPAWYMSGNGGNHVVILPTLDAVAVVTTRNFNTRGMHDQTARLLEQHVWPRLRCRA
jgi:CubicO group peptidase (beta-lactamase class C family)